MLGILEKRYSQYFTSIQSTLSFSSLTCITNANKLNESDDSYNDQISPSPSLMLTENCKNSILSLKGQQMHQLKHRELFYSRYTEFNVPISLLRGKLELNLFIPDICSFTDYLFSNGKSKFFYQLTYDPNQKMLSADYRQPRTGNKFQADIPELITKQKKKCNFKINGNYDNETLQCNFKANELTELSLKRYINKIFNKKLDLNKRFCDNEEINETKDLIMVCIFKIRFYLKSYKFIQIYFS